MSIFILNWIIYYIAIMFCMSVDNLFWIPTSPEYEGFKRLPLFKKRDKLLLVEGKTYNTKLEYIIKYRIGSVLTHWRDIIPAIITSLLLTIIFN